jgi:protein-L-isoaspartate(D-aspartate) O-methyltransferase
MLTIDRAAERKRMVEQQLVARGIHDERVLAAMGEVPREQFVPEDWAEAAYDDGPLPISQGQTVSQPYVVALMAQEARIGPSDRVLEVGTGSGYAAAVLARLAQQVYTVERHGELADGARRTLDRLGIRNVMVVHADGSAGLPQYAPFDAILASAAAPAVPETLEFQLADGGRMVIPVSDGDHQELVAITRKDGRFTRRHLGRVQFVPLVGEHGWRADE